MTDVRSIFTFYAASKLYEMALNQSGTWEFIAAVDGSELEHFGFTDNFLIDVWGIVSDAKAGRIVGQIKPADD